MCAGITAAKRRKKSSRLFQVEPVCATCAIVPGGAIGGNLSVYDVVLLTAEKYYISEASMDK